MACPDTALEDGEAYQLTCRVDLHKLQAGCPEADMVLFELTDNEGVTPHGVLGFSKFGVLNYTYPWTHDSYVRKP
nr:hypothetical protein BaRGS_002962 [Batillaria attramentaria]